MPNISTRAFLILTQLYKLRLHTIVHFHFARCHLLMASLDFRQELRIMNQAIPLFQNMALHNFSSTVNFSALAILC